MSNKDNYTLQIDDVERRLIVVALSDLKDKQKEKNKSFDFLDELIVKPGCRQCRRSNRTVRSV